MSGRKARTGSGGGERQPPSARPARSDRLAKPFPPGRSARPQADGDPDNDSDFAGDRSAAAEDVAQSDAPENGGWSGAEDNVEKRPPGGRAPTRSDPHHRGDRRS